jgi:hypothetical protein
VPEDKPIRVELCRERGFRRTEIATLAQRNFYLASTVVSDGLHCFTGVGNSGCVHQPTITGSRAEPRREAGLRLGSTREGLTVREDEIHR